ncbi:hypothetical protein FFI16_005420 [Pseudomonas sp. KBS0710]|nr:hypothetical protein FFI16_005420 [Pseudomonas sp. KBS0710]
MTEPEVTPPAVDTLSAYIEEQQALGPLMSGAEWSMTRVLMPLRKTLERFYGCLDVQQQQDYLRLQRAYVQAQTIFEAAIDQLVAEHEATSLSTLTAALKKLAGKEVDPKVARIHTRYVKPADTSSPNDPALRVPRAVDDRVDSTGLSSITLWEAACMNYSALSGWSFPGHVSLTEASYLDSNVGISAGDFIGLVRELNLGDVLRKRLDSALQSTTLLGAQVMALATAELEFALIEALRTTETSRVDREKYQAVVSALSGESPWEVTEEVKMFIPHGPNNTNGTVRYGLLGVYTDLPRGDYLSIPYVIFSVKGCKGAFSYFPNRPGGAFRHYDKFLEAAEEFYVGFKAFHARKEMRWLYQSMSLSDYARLSARPAKETRPEELNAFARLLYRLFGRASELTQVNNIGYRRQSVNDGPTVSLCRFYIERCRSNLKVLAHETPGIMATLLEFSQTLFGEIISLLLIPAPGPLKGLGRLRAFAMFVSIGQTVLQGLLTGETGHFVQAAMDIADLLSSRFLHLRVASTVRRRHQALYQRLAQQSKPLTADELKRQTDGQLVEKMMGATDVPTQTLARIVNLSKSSRADLEHVWDGAPPSASLVEAVHRFNVDKLIDWAAEGADAKRPEAVGAVDILAPLLTRHKDWPKNTSLSLLNPQGVEVRRYSKRADHKTTAVVTVTVLENGLFAYSMPRRISVDLPQAVFDLLPDVFLSGRSTLVEQLADRAATLRIDLFEALTAYANTSRSMATGAPASVLRLLPDSVASDTPPHPVIEQLHILHPRLSRARLLEVLRRHPLSEHQQTQLLQSQLQPEALYTALRSARQVARADLIVDGVFHPRRFSQKTQNWATEFAACALRDLTGQVLIISPEAQAVPYVSRGPLDKTIVVTDHGRGQFSLFDTQSLTTRSTEPQDLYQTVVSQISEDDLLRLGWDAQDAASQFRHTVARTLLDNRTPDDRFYPSRREIGRYASVVETSNIVPEPDALGLYSQGTDRYLFIEGEYYKVVQEQGLEPWRIQHPSLEQAYAPVLTHNGAGAWRHEWENPLTWDGQKPFQRLGPWVRELTPDAIVQIQQISGVTPAILRRVHVRNERPPAILRETVERFTIHQRVKSGVEVGRDFYDELLGEVGPEAADALVGTTGASRTDQITVLETKLSIDKPQMERLFFKALCHKSEPSSDPLARVLQRDFPSLTAAIAEDLVSQATPAERSSLESARVPLTLTPYVRWYLKQLRRARAVEGVYLPAAMNEDSAKLILHTLPDISGWSSHLRVEVWERGSLIDSIGTSDGLLKRVLEPVAGGYRAYIPQSDGSRQSVGSLGPFLPVLLDALPSLERQAIGYIHEGGVNELILEIGRRLDPELRAADTLLGIGWPTWQNPPRRVADGRVGYPLSGEDEWKVEDRNLVSRMRVLFPSKTDTEAWDILLEAGDSFLDRKKEVDKLFHERKALDDELSRWLRDSSGTDPQHPAVHARGLAAARIQRSWAKEGFTRGVAEELNLDDLDLNTLPTIRAFFGDVTILSLRNNRLSALPEHFLRGFPALRQIYFNGNQFIHVPDLEGLPHLKVLNLSNNRLVLNLQDEYQLAQLRDLRSLDLSGNPLGQGRQLSFYAFRHLRELNLRNCQLDRLPLGAVSLASLRWFDLRDNKIQDLVQTDVFIYPDVHRGMNLRGNPLSSQARQILRLRGERPGQRDIDFGLWEPAAGIDQSANRWLALLPPGDVQAREQDWAALQAQPLADSFFELLGSIAAYPRFVDAQHRVLRESLTRRVWELIDAALSPDGVERIADRVAYGYMDGGIDGWLLGLHRLELLMLPPRILAEDLQSAGPRLAGFYRAWHRLNLLDQQVDFHYPDQSFRQACTRILSCRIALQVPLELLEVLPERFNVPIAELRPETIRELTQIILSKERKINWPAWLQNQSYWIEFLERKYANRLAAALNQYDRPLELATRNANNGVMTQGQYLHYVDTLQAARQITKNQLIQVLTLEELEAQ